MQLSEGVFCLMLTWCAGAWWVSTRVTTPLEKAQELQFTAVVCFLACTAALFVWACAACRMPRWQMLPGLVSFAIVTPKSTTMLRKCLRDIELLYWEGSQVCVDAKPTAAWQLRCMYAAALMLTALSALLMHQLPLVSFPRVSAILWRFRHVGLLREELALPKAKCEGTVARESARFPVRIYYPAAHGPLQRPAYIDRTIWRAVARAVLGRAPAFIFSHLPHIQIDLAEGAPLHPAAQNLPAVVFSHGNSGLPAMYWGMISNLVQAGHIVICPEHNDGSAARVVLEDGSTYDYERPNEKFASVSNPVERRLLEDKWRREQLQRRVAEATASMSWLLERVADQSSQWYQAANLEQLAYIGHSFGGATAVVAANQDVRAKVCAAFDCWAEASAPIDPQMLKCGINRCPTLLVQCEAWVGGEVDRTLQAHLLTPWEKKGHPANLMWVAEKARHGNFTDFPLLAPNLVRLLRQGGTVNGATCTQATLRQTMEFFALHFKPAAERPSLRHDQVEVEDKQFAPFPPEKKRGWLRFPSRAL